MVYHGIPISLDCNGLYTKNNWILNTMMWRLFMRYLTGIFQDVRHIIRMTKSDKTKKREVEHK
jgi:hypothetical protein